MLLQEFKFEVTRRRERISAHYQRFHRNSQYKGCENKISHKKIDKDLKFLELLWTANSADEISFEFLADCNQAFLNELEKYFKFSQSTRHLACETFKNQFHLEHGLKIKNPEFAQASLELQKAGTDPKTIQRLLTSCPPKLAEMSWHWAKEQLPIYSRTSATNPLEACDYLRDFLISNRNTPPEIINKWLTSYNLAAIDMIEPEDFRKVCVGIRHSLSCLKNQLTLDN